MGNLWDELYNCSSALPGDSPGINTCRCSYQVRIAPIPTKQGPWALNTVPKKILLQGSGAKLLNAALVMPNKV